MEDPVEYDGGNPIRRTHVGIAEALAGPREPAPDDHFESQADATIRQWAALRRSLDRANQIIDELRKENAESTARIAEILRANAQLEASLSDSLAREGDAKEQAGWLKGIMTAAAGTLMEGIGPQSRLLPQSLDGPHRAIERRRSSQQ